MRHSLQDIVISSSRIAVKIKKRAGKVEKNTAGNFTGV